MFFVLIFFSSSIYASMESNLRNFFESMGASSNATMPNAYKDQQGGYISGGGIMVRGPVENTTILNLEPPSFNAGCVFIEIFIPEGDFPVIGEDQCKDNPKRSAFA